MGCVSFTVRMVPSEKRQQEKRARPDKRWSDRRSKATAWSLQDLSMAVSDRALGKSHIHRVAMDWRLPEGTEQRGRKERDTSTFGCSVWPRAFGPVLLDGHNIC